MDDRTQPTHWPTPEDPPSRPVLADHDRFFDPGHPWCAAAAGHPQAEGGYPDPEAHSPFHECRTDRATFDTLADLDGQPLGLDVYAAAPFRFGQPRHPDPLTSPVPRVVVECYPYNEDTKSFRFSLTADGALGLARQLVLLAELLTTQNVRE